MCDKPFGIVLKVTHPQRSPDALLLRGDSHGYQETRMRSWKT